MLNRVLPASFPQDHLVWRHIDADRQGVRQPNLEMEIGHEVLEPVPL